MMMMCDDDGCATQCLLFLLHEEPLSTLATSGCRKLPTIIRQFIKRSEFLVDMTTSQHLLDLVHAHKSTLVASVFQPEVVHAVIETVCIEVCEVAKVILQGAPFEKMFYTDLGNNPPQKVNLTAMCRDCYVSMPLMVPALNLNEAILLHPALSTLKDFPPAQAKPKYVFWMVIVFAAFGEKCVELVTGPNSQLYRAAADMKSLTLTSNKRLSFQDPLRCKTKVQDDFVIIRVKRPLLGFVDLNGGERGHLWNFGSLTVTDSEALPSKRRREIEFKVRVHGMYRALLLDQSKMQVDIRIGRDEADAEAAAPIILGNNVETDKKRIDEIKQALLGWDWKFWGYQHKRGTEQGKGVGQYCGNHTHQTSPTLNITHINGSDAHRLLI